MKKVEKLGNVGFPSFLYITWKNKMLFNVYDKNISKKDKKLLIYNLKYDIK